MCFYRSVTILTLTLVLLASLQSVADAKELIPGHEVKFLSPAVVEEVNVERVDFDPFGDGRKIIVHIDVRACGDVMIERERKRDEDVLFVKKALSSNEARLGTPFTFCKLQTLEFPWSPGLGAMEKAKRKRLLIHPTIDRKSFAVEATAFRAQGRVAPTSTVMEIIDYKDITVR